MSHAICYWLFGSFGLISAIEHECSVLHHVSTLSHVQHAYFVHFEKLSLTKTTLFLLQLLLDIAAVVFGHAYRRLGCKPHLIISDAR